MVIHNNGKRFRTLFAKILHMIDIQEFDWSVLSICSDEKNKDATGQTVREVLGLGVCDRFNIMHTSTVTVLFIIEYPSIYCRISYDLLFICQLYLRILFCKRLGFIIHAFLN